MALPPLRPLPKLQRRMPIVGADRTPTDAFHRYFNVDFAGALTLNQEALAQVVSDLADVVDELAAQLLLIQAAQDTADDALALAMDANGSKYLPMTGPFQFENTADNVTADVALMLAISAGGITIDANTSADVQVIFSEYDGVTDLPIGSGVATVNSTGIQNLDLSWNTDVVSFSISGFGTYTGTVIYRINLSQVSGANLVSLGSSNGTLTMTPKAA